MAILKTEAAKLQDLKVGMKASFKRGLDGITPDWKKIGKTITSETSGNAYGWLGKFPQLKEWVNERTIRNIQEKGFVVSNKKFESTLGVARSDIEDDNLGQYGVLSQAMAEEVVRFQEVGIFNLLKNGHTSLIYDGQNFFDTDHPVNANTDGSGTDASVSNVLGDGSNSAWYLLDTSRVIKPTILQERTKPEFETITDTKQDHVFMNDEYLYGVRYRCAFTFGFWQLALKSTAALTAANFSSAKAHMRKFTADGGQPLGINPTLLVVPVDLEATATDLIKSQFGDGGKTNTLYNVVEVLTSAYL